MARCERLKKDKKFRTTGCERPWKKFECSDVTESEQNQNEALYVNNQPQVLVHQSRKIHMQKSF